jgi:hypothetical protein
LGRPEKGNPNRSETSSDLTLDDLFEQRNGELVNVESKWGQYAGFTDNQRAAGVPSGAILLAVPTEATAQRTGLPRYPQVIQSRVFKWLWDGIGR